MKVKAILSAMVLFGLTAEASQKLKINISKSDLKFSALEKNSQSFTKIEVKGFETDRRIGAPELPVKSFLVKGTPSEVSVSFKINNTDTVAGKPFPVQEQDCRCATDKVKTFKIDEAVYAQKTQKSEVTYLGAYRGQPISRVDLRLAAYDSTKNQVQLVTDADVEINADTFSLPRGADMKDFLIIAPANLVDGVADFAAWKRAHGYNVTVETVASPNNTTAAVQALIKKYYRENGTDFVMIVGDETAIPMFRVATSGSSQTPSDLPYFTMDGAGDFVPDVLSSRIVAASAAQVSSILAKSVEFESRSYGNSAGNNKFVGIASNEGSNPSDDQYVKSIEAKYKQVLNSEIVHFHQNDTANSKPANLNAQFDGGFSWLTYLGHGSGTSWPSMAQSYSTTNVRQINNKPSIKPIIIDVACQNGRLVSSNLGSSFMRAESLTANFAFGAVAYYGGSVNISWHPPAVMAQGIAFEHLDKHYAHLGEALLAGQLYLAGKWANKEEAIDNFEWYHLQGDPSLNISF